MGPKIMGPDPRIGMKGGPTFAEKVSKGRRDDSVTGVEKRLETVRKYLEKNGMYEEYRPLFHGINSALLHSQLILSHNVNLSKVVGLFEDLIESNTNRDEVIAVLRRKLEVVELQLQELREEVQKMKLQAGLGDLASFCLRQIYSQWDVDHEDLYEDSWEHSVKPRLSYERNRCGRVNKELKGNEFVDQLFKMDWHSRIEATLTKCGWTKYEYSALFNFVRDRNQEFHSSYESLHDAAKRELIRKYQEDVSSGDAPAYIKDYSPVLLKVCDRVAMETLPPAEGSV
eukprot:gene26477-31999_t